MGDPLDPAGRAPGMFEDLVFDITVVLRQATLFDARRRQMSLEERSTLARQIVEHLLRSGVTFGRQPPKRGGGFGPEV